MGRGRIFCRGEMKRFPASEFLREGGELVVPYVHKADRPHYAETGEPVAPGTISEPFTLERDDRGSRIPGVFREE